MGFDDIHGLCSGIIAHPRTESEGRLWRREWKEEEGDEVGRGEEK